MILGCLYYGAMLCYAVRCKKPAQNFSLIILASNVLSIPLACLSGVCQAGADVAISKPQINKPLPVSLTILVVYSFAFADPSNHSAGTPISPGTVVRNASTQLQDLSAATAAAAAAAMAAATGSAGGAPSPEMQLVFEMEFVHVQVG